MAEHVEVSLLTHTERPTDLGVRLSSMPRDVLDPSSAASGDDTVAMAIGPRFIGHVALAAHDNLVAIGHVAEHELQVWCGSARQLTRVTEFAAPVPAGGLVSLVRFRDEWHLFARSEHGRSSHLVSTDLCEWTHLTQLVSSFPSFAVSGVAVRDDDLLLAGRVFVDNTAFGWGLLRSDGRNFEARPVPLPLATQLGVVGPVVNRAGDTVLLLDSGHNRTVATSTGTGWTLSLLVPDVTPVAVFAADADLWAAGPDNASGVPSLSRITDDRVIALPAPIISTGSTIGRVRSALVHGSHLILAREG
jgi:hypothetical protein